MRIRPLDDNMVVVRSKVADTTLGGIVLPDNAKDKADRGEVLAIGPGKMLDSGERVPMQVKVGEVVLFTRHAGNDVTVGTDEYVILCEDEVLGIV